MPDQHPPQDPHTPTAQGQPESIRDAVHASAKLESLAAHVLAQPPSAALPCNLPDEWLDLICHDLERALGEDAPQHIDPQLLEAPMALVLHILVGQHGETGQAWSLEDLFDRLQDYRVEIALELLNRRTGVHTNPATMATIFKQREVIAEHAFLPQEPGK